MRRITPFLTASFLAATVSIAPAQAATFETSVPESYGINDPSCVSEVEPVVLIHGTSDNSSAWTDLIPRLQEQNMCVWAFDYGADDVTLQNAIPAMKAIGDLDASAREIAEQIEYVRSATGSDKVNLVGHSQGGLHTKTFTQLYGSPEEVSRVVAIGGNYHGTTLSGMGPALSEIAKVMPKLAAFLGTTAGIQQLQGSDFIEKMNNLPDTAPGVKYTSIYSPADTTVTPNETSKLTAVPGADVENVSLGDVCEAPVAHPDLPHDSCALDQVMWGLTR